MIPMPPEQVPLPDLGAVRSLGRRIATVLEVGDVVALSGDLGAGKTTLARMILESLGYEGEVPSPTFTILETYDPPALRMPLVHADFYRLRSPDEAAELGLADYRDGRALLAEWPEKAGDFTGEGSYLGIHLTTGDTGRMARIDQGPGWLERTW